MTKETEISVVIPVKNEAGNIDQLIKEIAKSLNCLLYTSPSPRDVEESRMPSSA